MRGQAEPAPQRAAGNAAERERPAKAAAQPNTRATGRRPRMPVIVFKLIFVAILCLAFGALAGGAPIQTIVASNADHVGRPQRRGEQALWR